LFKEYTNINNLNYFVKVLEEENAPVGVVTLCCGGVDIG
jgi:hypothetical protein